MSEIAKKLNQCKKPQGILGKVVVEEMNLSHFELTSWGLEKIEVKKDSVILDIGCGGGKTINRFATIATEGKIFGMDYSLDCVKWSENHNKDFIKNGQVEIIHASVEKIPYEDNKFDIVTAVETIYFWPNLIENFTEVKRVLKPKGKFVIIIEMYSNERFKEKNEKITSIIDMKIHKPEELKQLLETAGYSNVTVDLVEEKNWLCCIGEKM